MPTVGPLRFRLQVDPGLRKTLLQVRTPDPEFVPGAIIPPGAFVSRPTIPAPPRNALDSTRTGLAGCEPCRSVPRLKSQILKSEIHFCPRPEPEGLKHE